MRLIVLGAAAGGGFPQWNCRCPVCARAWEGDPAAQPRTQCSVALSADGARWLLINASPDLRQQILATPALHPEGIRQSPIEAVLLTGADVDACAGLLNLRERQPFMLLGTRPTLEAVDAQPVFSVLGRDLVRRRVLEPGGAVALGIGLSVEVYPVPGKVPLWLEGEEVDVGSEGGEAIGLHVTDATGAGAHVIPGCAALTPALRERLRGAPLMLFDGTLFEDDEMVRAGLGTKTGRRMGHMSMNGPDGSLAAFADLDVARKVYVHVNNTNPALLDGSRQRRTVEAAGWEVAHDGMEIVLA